MNRIRIACPTCGKEVSATKDWHDNAPSWHTHLHKNFRGVYCDGGDVARADLAIDAICDGYDEA